MESVWRAIARQGRSIIRAPRRNIYGEVDRYKNRDMNSASSPFLFESGSVKAVRPLQFSKSILDKNGGLRLNEIPEALKFSRPFQMTTLDNGIRVCTEHWPGKVAAVGVIIGAGSRHETLQTSGTAHFMEHLHFKVGCFSIRVRGSKPKNHRERARELDCS